MRRGEIVLVQVGKPSRFPRARLVDRLRDEASRAMWGSSCTDRGALQRECFTYQRCGQTGASTRDRVSFASATISIALVDGDDFVGLLMGSKQRDTLFVYNVCVEHSRRGRGFGAQLFARLASAYKGPVSLTVYSPVAPFFRGNAVVLKEATVRFRSLLRMYARYGFEVVGVEGDMVRMSAPSLRRLPSLRGQTIVG